LLEHPFLHRTPPKSCGREDFDLPWLLERLSSDPQRPEPLRDVDVQATLAEFTASTLADSVTTHAAGSHRLLVCGGGAHNAHVLARLAAHLPDMVVETTADHGLAPTHVEAAAFAWLAQQRLLAEPGNLPAVTGARGPRVLGALYSA
jgi:anhydro-N-acetylmuramic acid kinase